MKRKSRVNSFMSEQSTPFQCVVTVGKGRMCGLNCIFLILVSRATTELWVPWQQAVQNSFTAVRCAHAHIHTHARTQYILNWYTWTNTVNYPDSTHTCRASGFQRAFFSSAGVEPRVFCGLFFSVRMTPLGSSRRQLTKFFSCQPTWKTNETWLQIYFCIKPIRSTITIGGVLIFSFFITVKQLFIQFLATVVYFHY